MIQDKDGNIPLDTVKNKGSRTYHWLSQATLVKKKNFFFFNESLYSVALSLNNSLLVLLSFHFCIVNINFFTGSYCRAWQFWAIKGDGWSWHKPECNWIKTSEILSKCENYYWHYRYSKHANWYTWWMWWIISFCVINPYVVVCWIEAILCLTVGL